MLAVVTRAREAVPIPARSDADRPAPAGWAALRLLAVETAKADLLAATAAVRGLEAQARGQYWQLQNAMEDVDNRVALLHARVAALDKSNATLKLAQLDFARAEQLLPSETISRQEYDRRQAALSVCAGGSYPSNGGCPSNPRLFGLASAAQKRRSRRGAARSRSDLLFRPRRAGSPNSDGGAARRWPFV